MINAMIIIGAWEFISGICGCIRKDATKSPHNANNDARDEIFKTFPVTNQMITAIKISIGIKHAKTPAPVATPLPPSNFKYGEKQCPITAKTAIVQRTDGKNPKNFAIKIGKTPFKISQIAVKIAKTFAFLGSFCFKTLKTFVAPILLLP